MNEGRTEWVSRPPAPALRPFIDGYVGYRLTGLAPGVHRGLPSRHLTFIVSIGEPIAVISQTDHRRPPARYWTVVSGLQARPALIGHDGRQEGVAIELTPLGCRTLLGLPARALWDTAVEAEDVLGDAATELWERLQATAAWDARLDACDDVLCRRLDNGMAVRPELAGAWTALVRSSGLATVTDVAGRVGWSRQHLTARFGDEFGLSPKLAARVVRFDRARRLLGQTPRLRAATVAAACGYYDQSHLNRDFVELAGCPPGEWLETELPSVQDNQEVQGRD